MDRRVSSHSSQQPLLSSRRRTFVSEPRERRSEEDHIERQRTAALWSAASNAVQTEELTFLCSTNYYFPKVLPCKNTINLPHPDKMGVIDTLFRVGQSRTASSWSVTLSHSHAHSHSAAAGWMWVKQHVCTFFY
eukprot:GHVU01170631.1.p2 GENE.GHVU01170631.1~~GHVU01170631.1.p2  ORF type:complete len:134 (-),score=8.74 GHVU01170631.1:540-941(-)